jgi:hypothetical protein
MQNKKAKDNAEINGTNKNVNLELTKRNIDALVTEKIIKNKVDGTNLILLKTLSLYIKYNEIPIQKTGS